MSQATKQVRVVALDAPVIGQDFEPTAFFDEDGNPVPIGGGGSAVTLTGYAIGTAAAVTPADTVNAAIAKLEARILALETP